VIGWARKKADCDVGIIDREGCLPGARVWLFCAGFDYFRFFIEEMSRGVRY
jgi:hypothetical protein